MVARSLFGSLLVVATIACSGETTSEESVTNVTLRPPGACGSAAACGYLRVRADGRDNNVGAQSAVDVLLGKLAQPYRDGAVHGGSGMPNLLPIEIALVDEAGAPMLDVEGNELVVSLGLAIRPSCD
jgi:hypothetical protein